MMITIIIKFEDKRLSFLAISRIKCISQIKVSPKIQKEFKSNMVCKRKHPMSYTYKQYMMIVDNVNLLRLQDLVAKMKNIPRIYTLYIRKVIFVEQSDEKTKATLKNEFKGHHLCRTNFSIQLK